MKSAFLIFFSTLTLLGCDLKSTPSLSALNKKCAEGKISGEYLIELKSGEIQKVYASSYEDLLLKINTQALEISAVDYNFTHKSKIFSRIEQQAHRIGIGQYGQDFIKAPNLWEQDIFGENVLIGVIDTGLDINHTLLEKQVFINKLEMGNDEDKNGFLNDVNGWDFVNDRPLTNDLQGHGTGVTSIIAAEHLNDIKIGVAPKSTILPVAALKPSDDGSDASADSNLLVKAVDYARSMNVDIINASWGGDGCSQFLRKSVEKAVNNQILFVTSAGNDGEDIDINLEFPSSFNLPFVISVGGVDAMGQRVGSSNFGSRLKFFAPGLGILSVRSGEDFNFALTSGTSIAAPFITGALALLKSALPSASNKEVLRALELSNDDRLIPDLEQALGFLLEDQNTPINL